jgi:PAS domain S-box-containing protein
MPGRHNADVRIQTALERLRELAKRLDAVPSPSADADVVGLVQEVAALLQEARRSSLEVEAKNRELLHTRRSLTAQRRRYRELFDFAPDGYLVTAVDGRIEEANRAAAALLRTPRARLLRRPMADFVAEADHEALRGLLAQVAEAGPPRQRELQLLPKDGAPLPAAVSVTAVRDALGAVTSVRWLVRDIADRRQAEAALKRQREALASVYRIVTTRSGVLKPACDQVVTDLARLLGASHVVVARRDKDRLLTVSAIAEGRLLGDAERPWTCETCPLLTEPAGVRQFTAASGLPRRACLEVRDFCSYAGGPVMDRVGAPVGCLCVMTRECRVFDEDELHLIDIFGNYVGTEIQRLATEEHVRELQQVQKLGELACGVAHEVRNPLNALLAIAEALFQEIGDNPDYAPFLDHIRKQVSRLSALMSDLLMLGRPIVPSSLKRQSLVAVCQGALEHWAHSAESKTHQVRLTAPAAADGLDVIADGARLQQVFLNLLENAGQNSPAGNEIEFRIAEPHDNVLRVRVVDRGTGIPTNILPRVFDAFFTTRSGGHGLGLSIVKSVVDNHGGRVDIWNNYPGPGCTVEVSIPAAPKGEP